MAGEVKLTADIDAGVDRRLRILKVLTGQSLGRLLSAVLDKALPPDIELAQRLLDSEATT